jgi:hypothetical protein
VSQYGSQNNTKRDYQKMTKMYALENLDLQRDKLLLIDALKQERDLNDKYRKELEELREGLGNQSKEHANFYTAKYCQTK